MDDTTRDQLAQRLSAMSLHDARKEMRALDHDAILKYWRNAVKDECHTLFELPNAGLHVRLVEKRKQEESKHKIGGGPQGWTASKVQFQYVEARVEARKQVSIQE